MNRFLIAVALLTVALATVAIAIPNDNPTAPATTPSPDEQAVHSVGNGFVKAYNAGDAKAVADLFVTNGEIVNQARESRQGHDAIQQAFDQCFRANPKAKIAVSVDSIRFLNPTTAVEDGASTVTSASGKTLEQNRYMVVYTKQDDAWKIASARDLSVEPASAAQELKDLQWLVGDWVDQIDGATVATNYRTADDGHALVSDFHVKVAGKPTMNGSQRIAWDPHANKIRSWVHDSNGGFAECTWTRNGNRWVVKVEGVTDDGRSASSTNVLTHVGKDRMTWQSRDRVVGDDVMPNIEPVTIVRKAPSPQ